MKIKHKHVIILLYLVAFLFVSISAYNLTKEVSMLDDEINIQKNKIQTVFQNQNYYQDLLQSTSIMINQWNILREINQSPKEFANIRPSLTMFLRQMLIYQHTALYGTPPDNPTLQKWQSLDVNQLISTHSEILSNAKKDTNTGVSIYDLSDVQTKIDDLESKKRSTISWAVIFNILGIIVTHLAIILDKYWEKN